MIKNTLKKILPQKFILVYKVLLVTYSIGLDYMYDFLRYIKYSASLLKNDQSSLKSFIIREYHAIEKGLALPDPRPGFGKKRILELINKVEFYIQTYSIDLVVQNTISALIEYLHFNQQKNYEDELINKRINSLLTNKNLDNKNKRGGTKIIFKKDIIDSIDFNFGKFVRTRYSIRDFSSVPINNNDILDAIEIARFTPSACNRQPWNVHFIPKENSEFIKIVLSLQNGNKGFTESISSLLIITGRISSFFINERNQVYIDCGMFAMSLVYALHSKGIGTCCLNTSFNYKKDKNFRKKLNLNKDEIPIMLIAIGGLKDKFKVAYSDRFTLEKFLKIYEK